MDSDYNRLLSSMRNYSKKLDAKEVDCPMNLIFAGVAGDFKNIYQQVQFEEDRPTQLDFVEMLKWEIIAFLG